MKSTQDEFTNKTQPFSWIRIGVSWKIAADAVLTKIQQEGKVKVGIRFGDSLMETRETINQDMLLAPVYMTMAGFAVENLIKGICIRDDPKLIDGKSGRLNKDILNHRLIRLANQIGFIDKKDKEKARVLGRLTCFVIWAGKYPVPTECNQYQKIKVDLKRDPEQINRLFDELMNGLASKGVFHIMPRLNWGDFVDNSA
jgi:hypothetical protein